MFDFYGKRFICFALSILILLAGAVAYIVNGVKLDIQFQGGTILTIPMENENFDTAKAELVVKETLNKTAQAYRSETINTQKNDAKIYLLTINIASSDRSLSGDEQTKLVEALRKEFSIPENAQFNINNVQPFIGKEVMNNGLKAIVISFFLIVLYIWWRFRIISGLSAGVMGVVALLHDAAIMFAVYLIFKIPLNDSFIAAVLTIIGYSMNDTVIFYDRIRENSRLLKKMPLEQLANQSITQTLNRAINTSVTTLISIMTVYIFSQINHIQSMVDFTFPLIIGIVSGCYSSIFIAIPLWVMWKNHQSKKKVVRKPARA